MVVVMFLTAVPFNGLGIKTFAATQVEQIIAHAKYVAANNPHGYDGACLAFVGDCYKAAGYSHYSMGTAYNAGTAWIVSTSSTDIPVGALVFYDYSWHSTAGHVGIYAGNGQMYDAQSDYGGVKLRTFKTNGYRGWGWYGGIAPTGAGNYTSPPTSVLLTINKNECKIGESFKISVSSDVICNYYMSIIDVDTNEYIYSDNLNSNYYESSFLKAGHYTAYVTAHNDLGSVDSNWVDFYVYGEKPTYAKFTVDKSSGDLGDSFTFTTLTDAYYNKIYISIFNDSYEVVFNGNISSVFTFIPNVEGLYHAYVTAYTHEGGVDSNWVNFSVGKFTVSYSTQDCNSAPAVQSKTYGADLVLSSITPTRTDYIFKEWNTKPDGTGVSYQPGDTYSENADLTLYAIWELDHEHEYISEVTQQPTCTEKGIKAFTCSLCNDVYYEDVDELGHDYIGSVTDPTCTAQGFTTYKCSRCDDTYIEDYTDPLNHSSSSWHTAINPTATSEGLAEKRCDYCGIVLDQFTIPCLAPDYVTGITLSSEKETVETGDTFTLSATVIPDTAKNKNVIWSSRNPEIVSVNNGKVTAIKPGTTAIVAETEDGGYIDFCLVRVISLVAFNGAVIDNDRNIIYGLSSNLESVDDYLITADDSMTVNLSTSTVGTGTFINVMDNGEVVDLYEAVIFGDVNGDSWYDGQDAVLVSCLANGMLTKEDVGEAVYTAADCNHDGIIDQLDVDLLNYAGALLANVDQSKPTEVLLETSSEYVEYLDLIDQSFEIEDEDETDIHEADAEKVPEADTDVEVEDTIPEQDASKETNFFEMIMNFIKSILEMLLTYIPLPIK